MNLLKYTLEKEDLPVYSAIVFCWGLLSDIDIESEFLRCLGVTRFYVYLVWRLIKLRRYKCTIQWTSDKEAAGKMPGLGEEIDNTDNKWIVHNGMQLSLIMMNNKYVEPELEMSPYSDLEDENCGFLLHKGPVKQCQFIK